MIPERAGELVRENERLDDLQRGGLYIIQDPGLFCFGIDAVLLSDFAACRPGDKVLDLCCGNGIIPLLIYVRMPGIRITGLEISERSAGLAQRSVALNGLEDHIDIRIGDIKEAAGIFRHASFDAVTANPPYMKGQSGLTNRSSAVAEARHELSMDFDDLCAAAAHCLKSSGKFYLVHRPARLAELITVLKKHGLEPKRMRLVHPAADKDANLVLIESVKGGRTQMQVMPPLVVYGDDGRYTQEIYRIYGYTEPQDGSRS